MSRPSDGDLLLGGVRPSRVVLLCRDAEGNPVEPVPAWESIDNAPPLTVEPWGVVAVDLSQTDGAVFEGVVDLGAGTRSRWRVRFERFESGTKIETIPEE